MNTQNDERKNVLLKLLLEMQTTTSNEQILIDLIKKPLLDTSDMAALFQKGKRTIHRWRKKGRIKSIDFSDYYYRLDDILLQMNSHH